jgi:hypothetical protein
MQSQMSLEKQLLPNILKDSDEQDKIADLSEDFNEIALK